MSDAASREELLGLLGRLARVLLHEAMNGTPHGRRAYGVLSTPRKGDLVVETSSHWRKVGSLGRLEAIGDEPGAYEVRCLRTGRLVKWENAWFLCVEPSRFERLVRDELEDLSKASCRRMLERHGKVNGSG